MSETKRKVPKLRFPGFTEDWEQHKLIDYLKVSSDKNKDNKFGKTDVLSVSGEYGIVNQIEFQGRSFAGVSVANYGVVEIGDVVYTKSPLKANPYGIIKTNKLSPGIVSTLYAVYKPLENIDSDFVQVYFEHDGRMNNYMKPLVNKGAKNDMKVTDENALKGDVIFPAKEEQERIVKCFSTLDNLITLHQRKLENLKLKKKALLQKLFPKNGEQFPELRFPGFTDAWEQRKLGELVEMISGDAPSIFTTGDNIYIKVDDLNYSDRVQISASNMVDINPKAHLVSKGATIFPKRGAAIMTNKVRIMGVDGYLDTNMMALIPDNIDKKFLFTFIQKTGLYKIADTSTIPQINNKHIEPYLIQVPSIKEQTYIGVIFEKLDNLITLHQRKLEHLQLQKKALLQQMFV